MEWICCLTPSRTHTRMPHMDTGISQLIHYPSHSVVKQCFVDVDDTVAQKGGYSVFYPRNTIPSTPKAVNDIHKRGGTILGTSRGGHDKSQIVDSIQDLQIDESFGFDTAVEEAQRAVDAAHVEEESVENGIGAVKLMGRYNGKASYHRYMLFIFFLL
ncbi:hypothetical protein D5086_001734 [Populus alba]|uniref:Uncharacterized protein n=1 Tax=Populus alba TaxID=43335 RepID=A0ACC4D0C7_POPAL